MTMRVLVCGGRDFDDLECVHRSLNALHGSYGIAVVIHGASRGADTLAATWATHHGVATLPFPADWKKHKNAAGPIRNRQMLEEGKPDLVVAFPGGRGTADMIGRAKRASVPVVEAVVLPTFGQ